MIISNLRKIIIFHDHETKHRVVNTPKKSQKIVIDWILSFETVDFELLGKMKQRKFMN
jgi:hypothetical protein